MQDFESIYKKQKNEVIRPFVKCPKLHTFTINDFLSYRKFAS